MGMAKIRKAEIAKLKADNSAKVVRVYAIRQTRNNDMEGALFVMNVSRLGRNDKGALLRHIARNPWGHNPPVEFIADYLVQTNSYKSSKMMGGETYGYFINFYEADPDDPLACSCREIVGAGNKEQFDAIANDITSKMADVQYH